MGLGIDPAVSMWLDDGMTTTTAHPTTTASDDTMPVIQEFADARTVWNYLNTQSRDGNTAALMVCRAVHHLSRITAEMEATLNALDKQVADLRDDMANPFMRMSLGGFKMWFDPSEKAVEISRLGVARNEQLKNVVTLTEMYGFDRDTSLQFANWAILNHGSVY